MTPSKRVPFLTGDAPFLTDEGDTSSVSAVKGTVRTVYGTKHTVRYKLPSSVVYRIKGIVQAERRTASTVMEKVVEDFLSVPVNNPLPYLPYNLYAEDWVVFSWTMPDEQKERLQARAMAEGRLNDGRCASNILVARAVMDYIANSPDDPMKAGAFAPVIGEEVPGDVADVPDAASGEPIPAGDAETDDADVPLED